MSIAQNFPALKPSLLLDFSNTEALDSRVTFNRASTATYYGTETAKAEENLLSNSNSFSDTTFWARTSIGVNDLTADFKGGTEAFTITANNTSNPHALERNSTNNSFALVSGIVFTISVFAKKGTNDFLQITQLGETNAFANFDLDTGVVGLAINTLATSMTPVGSDWYRCAITFTANNSFQIGGASFGIVPSGTSVRREIWLATGTESIDLAFAQAEQRSQVTAYTPTTDQPITNFIPVLESAASGVARFDHNPVTKESLGLLIEESRTNLLLRSEDFTTSWANITSTEVSNTVVAPDGTLTADKLIPNNGVAVSTAGVTQTITAAAAVYTNTIYAKAAEYNRVTLDVRDNATAANASVTASLANGSITTAAAVTGTFTSPSAAVTSVGNGWYRISLTFTSTGATALRARVFVNDSVATTGDGFSGIFLWGAQLEVGAFATSYIPTSASQVTRAADAASMTGANFSSWYNQGEGTLYGEAIASSATGVNSGGSSPAVFTIFETSVNAIELFRPNTTTNVGFYVGAAGATQANIAQAGFVANLGTKMAGAYKVNDFALSVNGAAASTDTSGIVPANPTVARIGSFLAGTGFLNGHIRKLSYYPQRLSNTNLQALTS